MEESLRFTGYTYSIEVEVDEIGEGHIIHFKTIGKCELGIPNA